MHIKMNFLIWGDEHHANMIEPRLISTGYIRATTNYLFKCLVLVYISLVEFHFILENFQTDINNEILLLRPF